MKTAIVYDWLVNPGGAENMLKEVVECFPDADIFTLIYDKKNLFFNFLKNNKVTTSSLNRLPFVCYYYQYLFPIYPYYIEQFDLRDYDQVISISHSFSKGVITRPSQNHTCIICTPCRYAWDLKDEYLEDNKINFLKKIIFKITLHKFRIWDIVSSNRVDKYVSISKFIQNRVNKVYRRESILLYPPVDVNFYKTNAKLNNFKKSDYYVICSRLVEYKNIDFVVKVFSELLPEKKLYVIGTGSLLKKIKKYQSKNIKVYGYLPKDKMKSIISESKAFIFPSKEDFGIAPIEAQACGIPVIALNYGGAAETIVANKKISDSTGVFFNETNGNSLIEAINFYEKNINDFDSLKIIKNAKKYSITKFKYNLKKIID
jgi:glycosyltransferase involved in cell wall biosynthesis